VIIAGPIFSKFLKSFEKSPPEGLYNPKIFTEEVMIKPYSSVVPRLAPKMVAMAVGPGCGGRKQCVTDVIIAGPIFSKFLKSFEKSPPEGLYNPKIFTEEEVQQRGAEIGTKDGGNGGWAGMRRQEAVRHRQRCHHRHADVLITIPTVIIAGPIFSKFLKSFEKSPPEGLYNPKTASSVRRLPQSPSVPPESLRQRC
jgi:H+/gluconate symporter-like permease